MKKYRLLILVLFGLLTISGFVSIVKDRVSGESFTENSVSSGNPRLHFRDEFVIPNNAARDLGNRQARPLSLTAADFDEDGMPDLIVGYADRENGMVTIQRGNVDLLFPSAVQQKQLDEGKIPLSPFHPFASSVSIPIPPDFVAAGDFDADGHFDLITAKRDDNKIYLLAGNGHGVFSAPQEKLLNGALTALAAGEINRRDGLTDIVLGLEGDKRLVLILESPAGAFRAEPEVFDLPEKANGFAFGQFDDNSEMDLAVANGQNLTVIDGRDRKLSYINDQTEVAAANVVTQNYDFEIKAVAAVNCGMRSAKCGLALLGADGTVRFFETSGDGFSPTDTVRLPFNKISENTSLITARVSARGSDDLIVFDRTNQQIHVINSPDKELKLNSALIVSLDSINKPTAVLPMRLNKDALSDLVLLRENEILPSVLLTAPQTVFVVNSTGNEGDMDAADGACLTIAGTCTFRAAREQAQYCPSPGPNPCGRVDEIRFNLSGSGTSVIDWYPVVLNHTITIDGYTQSGASANTLANGDNAVLKVQIRGPAGGIGSAVLFNGGSSVVRGLVFNDFCGRAAVVLGGTGNHIFEGNFTGTDTAATIHVGCGGSTGVQVSTAGNTVGGTTPPARNLLTDNGTGIDFFGGSNTLVQGNFIGTDRNGTQPLGGGGIGINVTSAPGVPGINNTIGGTAAGVRNIISGHNTDAGLGVRVEVGGANLIQGNYIGVDVTGARGLGNRGTGIVLLISGMTVGGTTPAARNIISANGGGGSGQTSNGIDVAASNALVQGNFIGTDVTGTIIDPDGVPNSGDELGNRRYGVNICDGPSCGGISNITIGGTVAGARNVISGNSADGVLIGNGANPANHLIAGNYIGTDSSGTLARSNGGNGITDASLGSTIGGTTAGARNVISANGANGILIGSFRNSLIQGNYIGLQADGTSALGNAQHGVFANGSHGASIGGTSNGAGNRIAYNGGDGVRFIGFLRQTAILGNSIFSNNLLGIELLDSANSNQAAPVLTTTTLNNGSALINGTLTAAANTQFRIEFFTNHVCDASGAGEGQTFVGTTNVTTNAAGTVGFTPNFPFSVHRGNFLTATATDPNGNTSKFSACLRTAAKGFDYDGDGKTDLSIFRPNNGQWWLNQSSNGSTKVYQFGQSTDKITPADYTGDGKTDVAFFRNGTWFVLRSENDTFFAAPFGTAGDVPAPGDFDGDAKADLAVFRPTAATWFILQSSNQQTRIVQFGTNGDVPVIGDYDGDAKADIAIFRPTNGQWWINWSSNDSTKVYQFGNSTDKPAQADYTGDGRTDVAFFRNGTWFILRSENDTFYGAPFGTTGDIPAPSDYDGDGRADLAVFRPTAATWFILRSTQGALIQQFGVNGDTPTPAAYIP